MSTICPAASAIPALSPLFCAAARKSFAFHIACGYVYADARFIFAASIIAVAAAEIIFFIKILPKNIH